MRTVTATKSDKLAYKLILGACFSTSSSSGPELIEVAEEELPQLGRRNTPPSVGGWGPSTKGSVGGGGGSFACRGAGMYKSF